MGAKNEIKSLLPKTFVVNSHLTKITTRNYMCWASSRKKKLIQLKWQAGLNIKANIWFKNPKIEMSKILLSIANGLVVGLRLGESVGYRTRCADVYQHWGGVRRLSVGQCGLRLCLGCVRQQGGVTLFSLGGLCCVRHTSLCSEGNGNILYIFHES